MTQEMMKNNEESQLQKQDTENITFTPDTDVYEADDKLVFLVNVPGVSKGDVNIEIDSNNILNIHAKGKHFETENLKARQFVSGDFYRAFKLNNKFDKQNVKASLEDGLLTITIGIKEDAKPKTIAISA